MSHFVSKCHIHNTGIAPFFSPKPAVCTHLRHLFGTTSGQLRASEASQFSTQAITRRIKIIDRHCRSQTGPFVFSPFSSQALSLSAPLITQK